MKLLSIRIENYKNLSGTYDFNSQNGYIALIGENGSGKSNLLEAISLIFGKLYKISNIQDIGKFRICYKIDGTEYSYGNIDENGNDIELDTNPTLPSSVISCYSGEDMRLWNSAFRSYYIDFFNKAIRGSSYIPKLLYINKHCWKIAFISLLYSDKHEVKYFLTNKLRIDFDNIKIGFKKRERNYTNRHDSYEWYKQVDQKLEEGEITISDLKNIDLNETQDINATIDQRIFYYLYLLSMPEKNTSIGLRADKLIEDIYIKINDTLDFDNLSEGEKKMILIECITQILGDNNSLILLDEPDAHTHIARKKELLEAIETFEGQTILTTHSPVFANMMNMDYIRYIEHGKIVEIDIIKAFAKITDNKISILEGALYAESGLFLLVEGKSDVACLRAAIDKLTGFQSLSKVAIYPVNGASQFVNVYRQVFEPYKNKIKKLIFLFDYDGGGYDGWDSVQSIVEGNENISRLFYQKNYNNLLEPTIKPTNDISCLLEDLFPIESYKDEIDKIHSIESFHDIHTQGNITEKGIKTYIENNCNNFEVEWFEDFKPLLTKLIELYKL